MPVLSADVEIWQGVSRSHGHKTSLLLFNVSLPTNPIATLMLKDQVIPRPPLPQLVYVIISRVQAIHLLDRHKKLSFHSANYVGARVHAYSSTHSEFLWEAAFFAGGKCPEVAAPLLPLH